MFDNYPLQVSLPAADLDRAMAWYAEKLGLKPTEVDEAGRSAWYESGGIRFLVYLSEFAGSNKATAASFTIEDFDSAMDSLRDAGVLFEEYDFGEIKTVDGVLETPDGTKVSWFKDSEGNILGLANV